MNVPFLDLKAQYAAIGMGDTGCFSFYPGKNLGAYGEAGAVVTNDYDLAEKMRMFRDHGQSKKYYPVPIHAQDAYRFLGLGAGSFPVAEKCAAELLSLPMFPELTPEQILSVANEVRGFYA